MSLLTCPQCHTIFLKTEDQCPRCVQISPKSQVIPLALLLGLGLSACDKIAPEPNTQALYGVEMVDQDGDGYEYGYDCDDEDEHTYPGAAAQDSEEECMRDLDQDGYGDNAPDNPDVTAGTDCDDSDPDINPGQENCE